jgi:hypothetical protein
MAAKRKNRRRSAGEKWTKWYDANQVCSILGMDRRIFNANLRAGVFPDGIMRPGEGALKWTSRDVAWMQYRMKAHWRFSVDGKVVGRDQCFVPIEDVFKPGDYPEELAEVHELLKEFDCRRTPCVYFLINFGQIVYVGQSINLAVRVAQHRSGTNGTPKKEFNRVLYCPVAKNKLCDIESHFIKLLNPTYNRAGTEPEAETSTTP